MWDESRMDDWSYLRLCYETYRLRLDIFRACLGDIVPRIIVNRSKQFRVVVLPLSVILGQQKIHVASHKFRLDRHGVFPTSSRIPFPIMYPALLGVSSSRRRIHWVSSGFFPWPSLYHLVTGNSNCFFPISGSLNPYLEIEITLGTLIAPVFRRPRAFVHVDWARNIIIMALFVPIH